MSQHIILDQVLDEAESLTLDEQEVLLEVLQKRLLEARRILLADEVREANIEFSKNKCVVSDADSILKEILS